MPRRASGTPAPAGRRRRHAPAPGHTCRDECGRQYVSASSRPAAIDPRISAHDREIDQCRFVPRARRILASSARSRQRLTGAAATRSA
jgi:hypothetical protein